jgi:Zn-dependent peptidase ImmA (M78 family)/transcriptional regulator with XRE-family HTH domain
MTHKPFNVDLLILARESRGLTQTDLSKALGITQGKISKIEAGLLEVSEHDMREIAKVLGYPDEFFVQSDSGRAVGSCCMYHRKRQTMPIKELKRIHAKLNTVRIQMNRLMHGAEIESDNKFFRMDVDEYEGGPEEIARLVRKSWGIASGPIPSVVNIIENAGGVVFRWPFGTRKLDAICHVSPAPPLFFVNTESPTDRMRFSLAHELGHTIMHCVPTPNQESEADRFAAEFLMPAAEMKPYLRPLSIGKAAALKPFWKVSMAALIKRAFDLGLIKENYYRKLFTQMSKLNYRTSEPMPIPDEEPTLLRDIIEVHLVNHKYSVQELSRIVFLHENEFREQYLPEQNFLKLAQFS